MIGNPLPVNVQKRALEVAFDLLGYGRGSGSPRFWKVRGWRFPWSWGYHSAMQTIPFLRLTRFVLSLLFAGLASSCVHSPTGRSRLLLFPEGQMAQLGTHAYEEIKLEKPATSDVAAQGYVQCIADAITRNVGGEWELTVFEDDTPNAFALPGGKIGVHTGLLRLAQKPDQLAAVVAHEVAHVTAQHGGERISQQTLAQTGLQAVDSALGDSESRPMVLGALGVGGQLALILPFSRDHETEADVMGQRYMAEAGFDPAAAIELWQLMEAQKGVGAPPEFLSTHPSAQSRQVKLRENLPSALEHYQPAKRPDCVAPVLKPITTETEAVAEVPVEGKAQASAD